MRFLSVLLALAGLAALACGGAGGSSPPVAPAATATPLVQDFKARAEAELLPRLAEETAALVRSQAWFEGMGEAEYALIDALRDCEAEARARRYPDSARQMLAFAAEQAWYQDGLDDREAKVLTGVFRAYTASLSDSYAPPVGTTLATTLRQGSFDVVNLEESGEIVVLVSSGDERLAQKALELTLDAMPRVEDVTGPFPYDFLYVEVTPEVPNLFAGLSHDEYIALAPGYVDAPTVIHEVTHSTLYGIFPLWFEEGFAHFLELYLTGDIESGAAAFHDDLLLAGADPRLDLSLKWDLSLHGQILERAQGLIFIKGIYDIEGIEGISRIVRALRTRTFRGHDLLRAIEAEASSENRERLHRHICEGVIGVRSGC